MTFIQKIHYQHQKKMSYHIHKETEYGRVRLNQDTEGVYVESLDSVFEDFSLQDITLEEVQEFLEILIQQHL